MFIGSGFGLNRVSAAGDAYGILNGLFRPALVMDFGDEYYRANGASQTFSDAMTHTRASTATMVDSDGVLKWGPHNLVARSEEFDNAFWVKSVGAVGGVTANATTAPSGTLTADKIENVSGGTVDTKVTGPISVAAKFITFQCYAKAGASNYLMMFIGGGVLGLTAGWFNLATGTVGTTQVNVQSATMTDAGNGWYLCKIVTVDVSGLGSATGLNVEVASADGVSTADAGDSIFVWGASAYRFDLGGMVDNPERGDSYVPTTASAVYMPRLGHHVWNGTAWVNEGLLHESEARTNLLPYSEDIANAAWVKTRMLLGSGISAPDGTTSSTKLIPNTTNLEHYIEDNLTPATGTFTDSVFAKAAEFKNLVIRPVHIGADQGATQQAIFDLGLGVVGTISANTTAAIQDFGNGWYRCSFTYTVSGTITGAFAVRLQINDNSNAAAFAGDDASGLYVFGAQREIGPTPSSYIPTNSGSTVTRSADVLTIPAANLPWPEPVVIGPELVTNGTFDTDTTGWTANSGGVLSSVGGQLNVTTVAPDNFSNANQAITVEVGKVYEVTATKVSQTVNSPWGVATTAASTRDIADFNSAATGTVSAVFVAPATTIYIQLTSISDTVSDGVAVYDNISVREINPLAVSIQIDGRVTYADTNNQFTIRPFSWSVDGSNLIRWRFDTDSTNTGIFRAEQIAAGVSDINAGDVPQYSSGVLVPINIAARHGSTFINAAVDGTSATVNTTPVALPNLSASNLTFGQVYNGTIRTFRMWGQDIGDAGLVEATEPSLVPSLSLTFDGTENSFIVEDWSE
jgi:hypothetical protein